MTWQLVLDYGPMGIMLGVAWAVWKGHLVLGRELTKAVSDNEKLERELESTTALMEAAQTAERETLLSRLESMKRELAELKGGSK